MCISFQLRRLCTLYAIKLSLCSKHLANICEELRGQEKHCIQDQLVAELKHLCFRSDTLYSYCIITQEYAAFRHQRGQSWASKRNTAKTEMIIGDYYCGKDAVPAETSADSLRNAVNAVFFSTKVLSWQRIHEKPASFISGRFRLFALRILNTEIFL